MNTEAYKLAVIVRRLEDETCMAHCESVRATATGDTEEEAVENLREAVSELIREFGEAAVFQDVHPNADIRVIRCAA